MTLQETIGGATSAAKTAITGSSQTIWESRPGRIGGVLVNDGAAALYVKLGTGCTADDYTFSIAANAKWEMPRRYWGGALSVFGSVGHVRTTEIF
jgi:hypothetical protein